MKRFDYITTETIGPMPIEQLNFNGKLGFEMCGVTRGGNVFRYYFKRELKDV